MDYPQVDWSDSASAADWLMRSITTSWLNISSLVPPGFTAYARLPHKDPDSDMTWRGALPPAQLAVLVDVLSTYATPPIWFAIWDGYGRVTGSVGYAVAGGDPAEVEAELARLHVRDAAHRARLPAARLRLPDRDYLLYRGDIADATVRFGRHHANLWWPDDRSWCVATAIGLQSTYVGGSDRLISAVIEALRSSGAHHVAPDGRIAEIGN